MMVNPIGWGPAFPGASDPFWLSRTQQAQAEQAKLPVKIMFPIILFIFRRFSSWFWDSGHSYYAEQLFKSSVGG
jgi:hypothetical protein